MLIMLSILTIVHEFGHYIVGRLFKVKILEFSVFMGPKIFSRVSKKTGIKYSLRWLPIGGYCAFEGEDSVESKDSFSAKPWYVRALILVAGAFMNILLAWIFIVIIFSVSGYSTTKITSVKQDYIAGFTQLSEGDKILRYDGKYLYSTDDYNLFREYDKDSTMELTVKKATGGKVKYIITKDYSKSEDGNTAHIVFNVYEKGAKGEENTFLGKMTGMQNKDVTELTYEYPDGSRRIENYAYAIDPDTGYAVNCTLAKTEINNGEVKRYDTVLLSKEDATTRILSFDKIGFSFEVKQKGQINVFQMLGESFKYLFTLVRSIYYSIYWLITGNVGLDAVMGPVGLTSVVSNVVTADAAFSQKLLALMNMVALIGVNLGVFNLLPFPALDGGKLFLILIELIRGGKKISPEKEGIISLVGFAVLIALAVVIAGKDIIALIKR